MLTHLYFVPGLLSFKVKFPYASPGYRAVLVVNTTTGRSGVLMYSEAQEEAYYAFTSLLCGQIITSTHVVHYTDNISFETSGGILQMHYKLCQL